MGFREQIDVISGLPPLTVLCGGDYSKSDIVNGLNAKFGRPILTMDNDVESVRKAIRTSYDCSSPILFLFTDVQDMSQNAINALLKVTEEPPNNTVFVLTVNRLDNLLNTIRSRAMVITLKSEGIEKSDNLRSFCEKVYDNIRPVPFVNALKIATYLKFKDTDADKYDLYEFFDCMMDIYLDEIKIYASRGDIDSAMRVFAYTCITETAMKELAIKGAKKDAVFDSWVIEIRGVK